MRYSSCMRTSSSLETPQSAHSWTPSKTPRKMGGSTSRQSLKKPTEVDQYTSTISSQHHNTPITSIITSMAVVLILLTLLALSQAVYRDIVAETNREIINQLNIQAQKEQYGFNLQAYPQFIQFTPQELKEKMFMSQLPAEIQLKINRNHPSTSHPSSANLKASSVNLKASSVNFKASSVNLKASSVYLNKDWTTLGKVGAVKDQGYCGACWAFAACADMETSFLFRGKNYDISQQQLIECSSNFGNYGCNGGWMGNAFSYVINNGISFESTYPYKKETFSKGIAGACTANRRPRVRISSYRYISSIGYDCSALTRIISSRPVITAVSGSSYQFIYYRSGVLSVCGSSLDHVVQVVGVYSDSTGLNYWKIKNSWGASWGQKGFMRVDRNLNQNLCGICSFPLYSQP